MTRRCKWSSSRLPSPLRLGTSNACFAEQCRIGFSISLQSRAISPSYSPHCVFLHRPNLNDSGTPAIATRIRSASPHFRQSHY
ncbi:hypothetical protein DEO72_LG6g287 [Vigna unguiculata]|uniref:Uncharacterized protein n=1 Tax=Vigna unguiculata TaxID=3917 RepID=A0A4D6M4A8_VIGUN|nr:hypothetical protein DEO72_LG6g287 [Vigna unguiculata]